MTTLKRYTAFDNEKQVADFLSHQSTGYEHLIATNEQFELFVVYDKPGLMYWLRDKTDVHNHRTEPIAAVPQISYRVKISKMIGYGNNYIASVKTPALAQLANMPHTPISEFVKSVVSESTTSREVLTNEVVRLAREALDDCREMGVTCSNLVKLDRAFKALDEAGT